MTTCPRTRMTVRQWMILLRWQESRPLVIWAVFHSRPLTKWASFSLQNPNTHDICCSLHISKCSECSYTQCLTQILLKAIYCTYSQQEDVTARLQFTLTVFDLWFATRISHQWNYYIKYSMHSHWVHVVVQWVAHLQFFAERFWDCSFWVNSVCLVVPPALFWGFN